MVKPILLLWDIDGTLIHSGGAGENALVRATRQILGVDPNMHRIDWAGRTDRRIAEMILEYFGRPVSPKTAGALVEAYLACLPEEMVARRGIVLPGIAEILGRVDADARLAQGLLTGNMERGARTKLGRFDLWHHFPFGAFADDSIDRNELVPHALRKAAAYHGRAFTPEQTRVIGDTPHDIECGRTAGARTIAVATGKYTKEALRAHGPDALLKDCADVDAFFDLLGKL